MNSVPTPLLDRVRARLAGTEGLDVEPLGADPARLRAAVAEALQQEGIVVPGGTLPSVVRDIADHIGGLGPLETLLREPGVTDVMLNRAGEVWVERDGVLVEVPDVGFASVDAARRAVAHVVATAGVRLDRAHPFADVRLPDGTRLHAVIDPVIASGLAVTLRRFAARAPSFDELVRSGSVPADAAALLRDIVADKEATVVCGRTGVGKTTLLERLVEEVGDDERVLLIEDSPELRPRLRHLLRLQTRPASAEGSGEIRVADLVRQALRMRPDRIVVGEVRGIEVADVLQALITGHEGCMTTVHARSAAQALVRLEGMALQAGMPAAAARSQIASAVDRIVVMGRGPDGRRGVTEIAAVVGTGTQLDAATTWERTGW